MVYWLLHLLTGKVIDNCQTILQTFTKNSCSFSVIFMLNLFQNLGRKCEHLMVMPLTMCKSYDVILSREYRTATKNKNVFGAVIFNMITKVGVIPELLITPIVWHKNKNRWLRDPLWRSCSLFCVVIFHSSFGLIKYPYTKQFTWSSQGIPPLPVLVIAPASYDWHTQIEILD